MKTVKFSTIIILTLFSFTIKGQYIQFSQYYAVPTLLAPSFAGATETSRVGFNYRDQWAKIKQSMFVTYSGSFDINVPKINSGFGVLIVRDEAGAGNLALTDFGVLYSWYALLNKQYNLYLRPGVQFKMSQRSLDFPKLIFGDQLINWDGHSSLKPTSQPEPESVKKLYIDATASMLIYNPKFWAGISADHLFKPIDAFYYSTNRTAIKYSVFGGYRFKLTNSKTGHRSSNRVQDYFFVSAYYRLQGKSDQLDIGGYWEHNPFTLGLWVRGLPYLNIMNSINIDAIVAVVGYKIFNFTIGYSYDITVSPIMAHTGGSHEISISYKFQSKLKSKRKNGPLPCPKL